MWLPTDPKKFSSKFKYVEFAQWRLGGPKDAKRWSVFRDGRWQGEDKPQIPIMYTWDEVRAKIDDDSVGGYYTSTFAFDSRTLSKAQSISSLYFDLDSSEKKEQPPQLALDDSRKLFSYLVTQVPEDAIRIYFSGKKGFHIECEAVALGVGPSADLADTFRFIANDMKDKLEIETIDFQCYDPRRMWRIPNTKHQGTGLFKIELTSDELFGLDLKRMQDLARSPREQHVPDQVFSLKANEWFREFAYKKQESTITPEERIARFMKHGSGIARKVEDMEFDPECFGTCEALERLWKKAETTHNLEHEERLVLCSLLTYSEEAIEYLHAILSNCDDYNLEKSQAHINDWIKRREMGIGGRPYTCARMKAAGIVCGSCGTLEPKEKYEVVGDRMIPTGEMASPSPVRFIYTRKTS